MGLTGFLLCEPKALSSVLRYNTVILGSVPQSAGEKELGGIRMFHVADSVISPLVYN